MRHWWRQKKKPDRWNTCLVDGCFKKTDHPDGPFCADHGWDDFRMRPVQ